jgi:hypothetical protein
MSDKMPSEKQIRKTLYVLLLLSMAVRAFLAGFIEFGNDEVYYWTYAKFPDLSHFDHPPMVGWVIQFFSLNLTFHNEFFIRLGSVILGTISTYIVFRIGKTLKDSLTGLYAAFLFTSSFYCFIIAGTFIMPDTPQVFFWLLCLHVLIRALPDNELSRKSRNNLILAGFIIGLALLSKYHSVFLILGAFLYILFFNRAWFRAKETYLAFLIAVIFVIPVIIWNMQNQFISFTYHESRIGATETGIRWDFFTREIVGQVFYNNPVNFVVLVFAIISFILGKKFMKREMFWFFLFMGLPLVLLFICFSLSDSTLPHWTGPAYTGYIFISASFLREISDGKEKTVMIPWPAGISLLVTILLIVMGTAQIKYGWIPFDKIKTGDFSTQLFGWRQLGEKFPAIINKDIESGTMPPDAPIITHRWFPAANIDYYVAGPCGKKVYALGTLERIHKYYWIDKKRGDIPKGTDAYYFGFSDEFHPPADLYGKLFDTILTPDTIPIYRGQQLIRNVLVYRMQGLKKEIRFDKLIDFVEPPEERVRFWVNEIRTHPEWLRRIAEKSKQEGRTLEDQIYQEAKWIAERERQGRD